MSGIAVGTFVANIVFFRSTDLDTLQCIAPWLQKARHLWGNLEIIGFGALWVWGCSFDDFLVLLIPEGPHIYHY